LTVSVEHHPGTLTETTPSTARLLTDVGAPNLFTYWQPRPGEAPDQLHRELDTLLEDVSHLHVFSWTETNDRLPLAAGAALWRPALGAAATHRGRWDGHRIAFLEFVRDDDPAQLAADAATLRAWLGS
jgi:3-dehydroshikimate dehydratase